MTGHVVPVRVYLAVFVSLLALTALTTWVAFLDLGTIQIGEAHKLDLNTVAALVIAAIKTSLVGLFFMHLRFANRFTRLVVLAGFFWLALLMSFTLGDVNTRHWDAIPAPWTAPAPPAAPATAPAPAVP
ncbi:MAG TPA: cytochrome C oxidase subunit IV family protein [Candidatus Acidoferrales bacterium]|nr:cytochrome C oxidase subunit IV family protein [Candidatus Acidoferrales bacterium]